MSEIKFVNNVKVQFGGSEVRLVLPLDDFSSGEVAEKLTEVLGPAVKVTAGAGFVLLAPVEGEVKVTVDSGTADTHVEDPNR